jgi:DNA-binding SARP family transcriptional activator/tetratricopeptide (TPR) repeat protein
VTIELCGHLSVSVDGRRREGDLPGRQGRLALAHLALNRSRAVTRERLIAALWGEDAPAGHAQALNVVLSKLRRALGPDVLENAGERAVQLTAAATVDLDAAQPALDAAFAARDRGDWPAVVEAAGRVAELADAGLLPGYEASWLEEPRRRLEELGLQARELRGDAGLAVGGAELAHAERAAQELVELAPFRESGYLLLMRVREAQGNLVEALRVHERLRTLLRDELGVAPGPQVQVEFERLLKAEREEPVAAAPPPPPAPAPAAPAPELDGGYAYFATRSGAAFVGRRGELERLRDYLQRAIEGERQLVLLEGEPGIGKTRLAMQFMEACEADGALTLYGRCDAETLVPYQPFVEALRGYLSRAPEQVANWSAHYGAELGRVVPEVAAAGEMAGGPEEEERYRLFDAVSEVLNDIARRQPVVLVLDDLHWADKPTLLMLRQMVRAAGESPLLIVATLRDTERPAPLVDMLVQLRREHFFERIELSGLDEEDSSALIGEFGPQGLPEHVNRTLWEETKGNPFFLEEMVRHLGSTSPAPEGNGAPWPLELPEGIREVIGRRLATLSERTSQVLTTAAVMGREFRVEVLEAVGPLDEDELDEVVEESVNAHVIAEVPGVYGRCSFTHALIRQTLYDGLTATRRARLHLRVGEALERLEAAEPPLAELAHHFSLAPPARGAPKAVEYAERAAKRAAAALAYEEAARLYDVALRALDQTPGEPEHRCRLLLACGDAQTKAGDTLDARKTFRDAAEVARALGSPRLLAQAALGFGAAGQMAGGIVDEALVSLLEEALAAVGEGDPALRARLLARLVIELNFSEARERRAELSGEAVEIARRVGDTRGLGFALVARHWSLWGPGNVQERLEAANDLLGLAESSGDERLAIAGHRWRMIDLLELGEIDAVDIEIDAYAQIAARRKRLSDDLYVHIYRSMRLLLAGEFEQAEAEGWAAVALGNRVQDPNTGNATLLQACTLRRERGGFERLEGPVRAYAERFAAIPGWRCVLAHLLAETGRGDEAREILDDFAAEDFRGIPLDGIWLGAVAYLTETAAAIGDPTHAATLHDLLEPYADRNVAVGWASTCTGSAARHLGLLADLLGRRRAAIAYFETALAMNERMRARPWVARTQVEFARLLSQKPAGRERAGELLDAGLAEAQRLGMPRLVELGEQIRAGAAVTPPA